MKNSFEKDYNEGSFSARVGPKGISEVVKKKKIVVEALISPKISKDLKQPKRR